VQRPVDHDAGAEVVVEQQEREAREVDADAGGRLGEGGEVDVVLDADRAVEGGRESRAEGAAVRPLVVADRAVGGHDPGHSDDGEVERALHGPAAGRDEGGDVRDAVFARGEGSVPLGSDGASRVDEDDVGRVMVHVHGGREAEGGVQRDAAGRRSAGVAVDPGRGDGSRGVEHPQHLGHGRAGEAGRRHELGPSLRSAPGEALQDRAAVECTEQGLRSCEGS